MPQTHSFTADELKEALRQIIQTSVELKPDMSRASRAFSCATALSIVIGDDPETWSDYLALVHQVLEEEGV